MSLQTRTLGMSIAAELTAVSGLLNVTAPLVENVSFPMTAGTGAGQADKLYAAERTVAGTDNEDLDLAGDLSDPFGALITFVKVKAFYVKADPTNGGNLTVSRPATNGVPIFAAAEDAVVLPPGAGLLLAATGANGLATVTPGTGDLINVANAAATPAKYRVVIIGTSA